MLSKFLLSNSTDKYNRLKNHFIQYGFGIPIEYKFNDINISFFNKINIENTEQDNVFFHNEDFVTSVGTLIYNGVTNLSAYKSIYKDFTSMNDINNIRKKALGAYTLIIKKDKKIHIFTDESAVHNTYYLENEEWVITNTFYHIAKVTEHLEINNDEIIEYCFQNTIIGNQTLFKNIKKLDERSCIFIDSLDVKVNVIDVESILSDNVLSINDFASKLKSISKIYSESLGQPTISMTGGLDSRLVLSSIISNNVSPNLIYGVGNSHLTNTLKKDLTINKRIAKKFNLNLYIMDWSDMYPYDKDWIFNLEKYGELFVLYGSNTNIFDELNDYTKNNKLILFGYFGEMLRSIDWIDTIKNEYFTIEEFVNLYINNNIPKSPMDSSDFRKYLIEKFKKYCFLLEINPSKIHKNNFTKIHYLYRKEADTKLCNFVNLYSYSGIFLSNYKLLSHMLYMDYENKKQSSFVINVIYRLEKKLLDIPLLSHTKVSKINVENYSVKVSNNLLINKIIYIFKIPYLAFKKILGIKSNSRKLLNFIFLNNSIKTKDKKHTGDIRQLFTYRMILFLLSHTKQ